MMDYITAKAEIKQLALSLGAATIGVCQTGDLVEKFHPEIRQIAYKLPVAISIGIALQPAVLDSLDKRPNEIYKTHYQETNRQLDCINYKLAALITSFDGNHQALPIPASKVMTRYPMIGHLNHREIAHKAGLGWRGKNNLLVNYDFGSRLRLTTLLTDLELPPDKIVEYDCGQCRACLKNCPAVAIGQTPFDFDLKKCSVQVTKFSKEHNYGQLICGLCLNHCPPRKQLAECHG